jgi:MFS family permease
MTEQVKEEDDHVPTVHETLTRQEQWNISFLLLAWACNVADISLIVGASAAIILSTGGSSALSPFGTGAFLLGMALVSLTCTHWIFDKWGRKIGFFVGNMFGIIGSIIGCVAIIYQSATLVIVSTVPLGAGAGVGLYLRFAAVEVVPKSFAAKAITWVLTGGCLAAFAGPEAGQAAQDLFGPDLEFLGVFFVAGVFYVAQGVFLMFISFPEKAPILYSPKIIPIGGGSHYDMDDDDDDENDNNHDSKGNHNYSQQIRTGFRPSSVTFQIDKSADGSFNDPESSEETIPKNIHATTTLIADERAYRNDPNNPDRHRPPPHRRESSIRNLAQQRRHSSFRKNALNKLNTGNSGSSKTVISQSNQEVWSLLKRKRFLIPMFITALSWGIIRMPSSILGTAMRENGYTDRQILTAIELHFLGMYIPGFWSGRVIARYGSRATCMVSMVISILAIGVNIFLCDENTDPDGTSNMFNASTIPWTVGMAGLGVAWNFSYSASTVWCTFAYNDFPHLKSKMQAANEFGSFLLSGALLFSAGYLFEAGGSGLEGWQTIQYFIFGLIVIFFLLVIASFQVGTGTDETIPENKRSTSRRAALSTSEWARAISARALRDLLKAADGNGSDTSSVAADVTGLGIMSDEYPRPSHLEETWTRAVEIETFYSSIDMKEGNFSWVRPEIIEEVLKKPGDAEKDRLANGGLAQVQEGYSMHSRTGTKESTGGLVALIGSGGDYKKWGSKDYLKAVYGTDDEDSDFSVGSSSSGDSSSLAGSTTGPEIAVRAALRVQEVPVQPTHKIQESSGESSGQTGGQSGAGAGGATKKDSSEDTEWTRALIARSKKRDLEDKFGLHHATKAATTDDDDDFNDMERGTNNADRFNSNSGRGVRANGSVHGTSHSRSRTTPTTMGMNGGFKRGSVDQSPGADGSLHSRSRTTTTNMGTSGGSRRADVDQSPGALKPQAVTEVAESGTALGRFRVRADAWLVNNLESQVARLTGEIGRLSSELDNYQDRNVALNANVAELTNQNVVLNTRRRNSLTRPQ